MTPTPFMSSRFKKPALVLAVAAICGLGLAGCNDNDDDDVVLNPAPTTPTTPTTPTPMQTGNLIALTESGKIVSVNREAPNALVSSQMVSGLQANDSLVGIDYRPANGMLYGVGALGNIYTIDPSTGVATFKVALTANANDTTDGNASFTGITGNPSLMSVDFNPAADRLRVMGNDGQNLRIDVDTGATITDGTVNGGDNPIVTSVAYTNSFAGTGTTRMFDIDITQDRLYQQDANAGTLLTSAPLGVDATGSSGFDIDGVNNMGYAALKVGGTLQLHSIDLTKLGTEMTAANSLGNLPADLGDLRGIALKPAMNAGAMVQGLTANNQLVSFSPLTPATTTTTPITGLMTGETIVGIDYRLRTEGDKSGVLYGLSNLGNLYMINADTGVASGKLALTADATDTSAPFSGLSAGAAFAVDFNPSADLLRVISSTNGESLRINVDTGATTTDGAINGIEGAKISAAAYTNSFQRSTAGTTMLFDLDQTGNQLVQQNAATGTVTAVGTGLGAALTLGASNGMDIAGGDNGLVLVVSGNSLYRVDLNTGIARAAVSVAGTPNLEASQIGSATTPALIDLAIMLK